METKLAVSAGDKLRLRMIASVEEKDGQRRRLPNGSIVVIDSIDASGALVLAGGAKLSGRQVLHGYAMTSHAAQGLTVDKVFMEGATSREGLYVSATRGREAVRIFVPDRQTFLEGTGLGSESRTSAIEFARQRALIRPEALEYLAAAWRHLRSVHAKIVAALSTGNTPALSPNRVTVGYRGPKGGDYDGDEGGHRESVSHAPKMRMGT